MSDPSKLATVNEEIVLLDGLPLRLSFEPLAVRQHFWDIPEIVQLSDAKLAEIGAAALEDDGMYKAFHACLCLAVQEVCGFDPDELPSPDDDDEDEEADDE